MLHCPGPTRLFVDFYFYSFILDSREVFTHYGCRKLIPVWVLQKCEGSAMLNIKVPSIRELRSLKQLIEETRLKSAAVR